MIKKIQLSCILLFIIMFISACMVLNPMRRSEKSIRENLLKKTPIGVSSDEVLKFVHTELNYFGDYKPYYQNNPAINRRSHGGDTSPVGEKSIRVHLGCYWKYFPKIPIATCVFASWAFDENDKLIDILVHKGTDAP